MQGIVHGIYTRQTMQQIISRNQYCSCYITFGKNRCCIYTRPSDTTSDAKEWMAWFGGNRCCIYTRKAYKYLRAYMLYLLLATDRLLPSLVRLCVMSEGIIGKARHRVKRIDFITFSITYCLTLNIYSLFIFFIKY